MFHFSACRRCWQAISGAIRTQALLTFSILAVVVAATYGRLRQSL